MKIIAQPQDPSATKWQKDFYKQVLDRLVPDKSSPLYLSILQRINNGEFKHVVHLRNSIKKHKKDPTQKEYTKQQKNIQNEEQKKLRLQQIEEQMDKAVSDPFSNVNVDMDIQSLISTSKNWYLRFTLS